jgi:AraC family transcriptional regulator
MLSPYAKSMLDLVPTGIVAEPDIIPRGALGLELIRSTQTCGTNETAAPFFSLQRGVPLGDGTRTGRFDFGAGRFEAPVCQDSYFVTPAHADCVYDTDFDFSIDVLSWPDDIILKIAGEIAGRPVSNFGVLHTKKTVQPQITQLINGLWSEIRGGNPNGKLLLDTASIQLIAMLVEQAFGGLNAADKGPALKDWRLRRAVEWIEDHLSSDLCINEIAREAGMSVSTLGRAFRAELRMSPYEFVRKRRMDRAKSLLQNCNSKIIDIALSVGYENSQYFATLFKSEVGLSPSEYRQKH